MFSDADDNEEDDNDDSEHSTGTHEEEDDDDEEDEVESDGVDMEEGASIEGDDEHFYPFFALEHGGGRQNAIYVGRSGGAATMAMPPYRSRSSGTAPLPPNLQWAAPQGRSYSRGGRDSFVPSSSEFILYFTFSLGSLVIKSVACKGCVGGILE